MRRRHATVSTSAIGTPMLHTAWPTTNASEFTALMPSAGTGVTAWKSWPSNEGLNSDWSSRPASSTP
ncbi:hypothetical protein EKG83_06420 [Saccharothrix syringae]|uniref:Uncharacterized protein n=1 Tax=Saccharothrix syringae TaxID=103733 RepID=A0A5Q0GSW6_SACSY|nr:hypothetical protein EKG83_06420 [Saccharothrix syringae]